MSLYRIDQGGFKLKQEITKDTVKRSEGQDTLNFNQNRIRYETICKKKDQRSGWGEKRNLSPTPFTKRVPSSKTGKGKKLIRSSF